MRNFLQEYHFEGRYVEHFANGNDHYHLGTYVVSEFKTRYLVTFVPIGCQFPLFKDFCILKKKHSRLTDVVNYIENNWL